MVSTLFDYQRSSCPSDLIQLFLANTPLGYKNVLGGWDKPPRGSVLGDTLWQFAAGSDFVQELLAEKELVH